MTTTLPGRAGLLDEAPPRPPLWSSRDGVVPRRDDLVDALGSLTLAALAIVGFQTVYLGSSFFVIGMVGAIVGTVTAYVIARVALHFVLAVPLAVAAFVIGGGIAVPETALAGVLPGPKTPGAVVEGLIQGWANLLTTAPPVGTAAGLGVVPYVCGFVAAGGAMLVARRRGWPVVPVVAPAVVLVVGFLFGTHAIVSTVLQGALFAVVSIGWGAVRSNRPRRSEDRQVHWPRLAAGVAMLAILFAVAVPVGTRVPFVDSSRREVLRDRFLPPFDPRNEPSPLASFRSYLGNDKAKQTVFDVEGLPGDARVRLATMDTYDGVVWVVGGPTATASGRFERVGAAIEPVPDGRPANVTVTVASDRADVWVPTVGSTHGADFGGSRAPLLAESFRYNRATGTGAAPVRLDKGDSVVLRAQLEPARDATVLRSAGADTGVGLPSMPEVPEVISKKATEYAGSGTPYEQAERMEKRFADDGYYSDGGGDTKGTARESAPGHSLFRLTSFVDNKRDKLIGNAEQYAATMALMARSIGLPARVVMGFALPPGAPTSGPVALHGADVDAWVEIAFVGHGWVAFHPTPDHNKAPPDIPQETPKEENLDKKEPPPPTFLEAPDLIAELGQQRAEPPKPSDAPADIASEPSAIPKIVGAALLPVLLVLGACLLIVALKVRRRNRRRTRGSPARRLGGAWQEVCDQARDIGVVIPPDATRREVARLIPLDLWEARALADRVDDAMFGFVEPDEKTVASVWSEAERDREAMLATLSLKDRIRASLSLTSLRPKRAARRAAAVARAEARAEATAAAAAAPASTPAAAEATTADERVLASAGRGR